MTTFKPSTVDTIRRLIDQQLNLSVYGYELGLDDDLWAFGMTSLTCLGLMLSIEDAFEIELPDEMLKESTFGSVNAIREAVEDVQGKNTSRREPLAG